MEEYDLTPDTTHEYDELHNVSGLYNLPKGEHRGQRRSYEYNPQYYIAAMEAQARQHQTAQVMSKPFNAEAVVNYYIGQKHYSPVVANKIVGAIESKIHRAHLEPAESEAAFMTAKQKRARRKMLIKV